MKNRRWRNDWFPALLLAATGAPAQELQPPEDIARVAEQFVATQLRGADTGTVAHVTADRPDPRLRLPRCQQAPTGLMPPSARIAARMTVGVGCTQPRWTVYVPVRVDTELKVLVLRKAAAADSAVAAEDVEARTMKVPGLAGIYISSVEDLAGRHLKRAAAPGTPLSVDLLAADILVRRGQRVTLVANAGGLEVRAQGEAVGDANASGRVRVLNLTSRRIVEGQVESRDRVRVSL